MIKNSIRSWLIAPLIVFFVIPLFLLGGYLSWHNYILAKEDIKKLQQKLTTLAADNIACFLHEQESLINSMLRINYSPELTYAELETIFSKFMSSFRDKQHGHVFKTISFLNDQGREVVRVSRNSLVPESESANLADSSEFTGAVRQNDFYYSPFYFNPETGEPVVKTSLALRDLRTLEIRGVFLAEMRLQFLWELIADMDFGDHGIAYLTNAEGRVIAHPNRSIVLRNTVVSLPDRPMIMNGVTGEESVMAAKKIQLGNQTVTLITETPFAEALQRIQRSSQIISGLLLFILSGVILLGLVIVNRIVKPLESLADTARKITEGDFSQKAETGRLDELGDLATAFNTMTSRLVEKMQEIKAEKDFARNVIESMTHPFYVIDASDYTIKLANSAANFGPLCEGDTCYKLTHNTDSPCSGEDHPCTVAEIRRTHKPVVVEHAHKVEGEEGQKIFEIYGFPVFDEEGELVQVIEHNIDVTEKKDLELQLMQSQKLEAIGTLTGGVAHDFNNLLTTIIGYSEIIMMNLEQDDPLYRKIQQILEAGNKAAGLTRQLLAFSRKQVMEIQVVNLNTLIDNMLKMLKRLIGEQIEIKTSLKSPFPYIMADSTQIEQIMMNLAVNARDAMPDGGTLYFETDVAELDRGYCLVHPEVTPGNYVVFCVTDTGKGMPLEIKEHIFDPFFTTKKKGEGTGLGLSTVYGIVKQLKGHILVYSEPGFGSTFKILFPRAEEKEQSPAEGSIELVKGGSETIMVVDDEPSIRKLVCDTLGLKGYRVVCAESGEQAIELYRSGDVEIDLLLTDVIMKGMNGSELADILLQEKPDLKVIFMSGYTDNIITHHGVLDPGLHFINKPLVPSLLTNKIREVLDTEE